MIQVTLSSRSGTTIIVVGFSGAGDRAGRVPFRDAMCNAFFSKGRYKIL